MEVERNLPTPSYAIPTHPSLTIHPPILHNTPTHSSQYTHPFFTIHPPILHNTPTHPSQYTHPFFTIHPPILHNTPTHPSQYTHPFFTIHPPILHNTPTHPSQYTHPFFTIHPPILHNTPTHPSQYTHPYYPPSHFIYQHIFIYIPCIIKQYRYIIYSEASLIQAALNLSLEINSWLWYILISIGNHMGLSPNWQ